MIQSDDPRGDIYLLSLDTFMIMSVVGLSLGMIFFLLNPSFEKGEDIISIRYIKWKIPKNNYEVVLANQPAEYIISEKKWEIVSENKKLNISIFLGEIVEFWCELLDKNGKPIKNLNDVNKFIESIENLQFLENYPSEKVTE